MPAPDAGDHFKAIFCLVPLIDTYSDAAYAGGAYSLALMMGWGSLVSYRPGEAVPTRMGR